MANKKVCVIGMGLIGGSIALAIKKEHHAEITGVDVDKNQLRLAKSLGVIDVCAESLEAGAKEADLVVVAVPVTKTVNILEKLQQAELKQGAIVTDVGSTKQQICASADFSEQGVTFIGGHPMAGSHKSGVQAAKPHLFENAYYVLTPTNGTGMNRVIQLQNWLKGTSARFIEMAPQRHDQVAGLISHFPHIIAAGLVHQVRDAGEKDGMASQLAAGGFRDITRIASANPIMWRDILLQNKEMLLQLLEDWKIQMNKMELLIEEEDSENILHYFSEAKSFRDTLPVREKGALQSFYDLFVDVPDHPGVISDVTGILAKNNISIINIRIMETREDITGVLQLTFRSETDREEGSRFLQQSLYDTYLAE
ncbi:prephenate dehydrogenase [Sinobaca qinghaiensis]|uniref:Prephenate dehydrogenase n=1 Tax=Sinobaca qinghaiensis TaxID=342944 RepID=A0A419V2U0_9BACL|nr:prephenate dehydrogenase [Sinobaca qinghaiensis]RKD72843.1 prephenate dehydrogenase [Sinobaca qinghaiensis]